MHDASRGHVKQLASISVACGLALGVVSCSTSARSPGEGIEVQVDVYSGREAPTARLSPEAEDALCDTLVDLRADAEPAQDEDSGLGFRGFVAEMGECSGDVGSVRVLDDAVHFVSGGPSDGQELLSTEDGSGDVFEIVWNDIKDDLDDRDRSAVEESLD